MTNTKLPGTDEAGYFTGDRYERLTKGWTCVVALLPTDPGQVEANLRFW